MKEKKGLVDEGDTSPFRIKYMLRLIFLRGHHCNLLNLIRISTSALVVGVDATVGCNPHPVEQKQRPCGLLAPLLCRRNLKAPSLSVCQETNCYI